MCAPAPTSASHVAPEIKPQRPTRQRVQRWAEDTQLLIYAEVLARARGRRPDLQGAPEVSGNAWSAGGPALSVVPACVGKPSAVPAGQPCKKLPGIDVPG